MLARAALTSLAVAAGLAAAASPAVAATGDGPTARTSGGDAPAIIPLIVQTRITRTENAIARLSGYVDDGDADSVARTGKVIRRQLAAAWRGAVYYIKNGPPPVGDDARVHVSDLRPGVRARIAGGGGGGPVIADPYTAAVAVFTLQHEVAGTIAELTDGARVPVLNAMSRTLFFTLDRRDKAVKDAHALEPAPTGDDARVRPDARARISGDAPGGSFAALMPQVAPQLDDEIRQIEGLLGDAKDLRPGGARILRSAMVQTLLTQRTVNTYWPPVTDD